MYCADVGGRPWRALRGSARRKHHIRAGGTSEAVEGNYNLALPGIEHADVDPAARAIFRLRKKRRRAALAVDEEHSIVDPESPVRGIGAPVNFETRTDVFRHERLPAHRRDIVPESLGGHPRLQLKQSRAAGDVEGIALPFGATREHHDVTRLAPDTGHLVVDDLLIAVEDILRPADAAGHLGFHRDIRVQVVREISARGVYVEVRLGVVVSACEKRSTARK